MYWHFEKKVLYFSIGLNRRSDEVKSEPVHNLTLLLDIINFQ